MPPNKLPQCIHRRIGQITRWQSGRNISRHLPQSHLYCTTTGHPMDPEQFNIVHKEVNSFSRDHQGDHVHPCPGPNPQQKLGKVPTAAYMGPSTTGIIYSAAQAFQAPPSHPPKHPLPEQVPPTTHTGAYTFLCKYPMLRSNTTPNSPYKLHPYTSAILVSFSFLFVSLTFLTDLTKWPK